MKRNWIVLSCLAASFLAGLAAGQLRQPLRVSAAEPPAGRYQIAHLEGSNADLLDTVTGAVWEESQRTYCEDEDSKELVYQGDTARCVAETIDVTHSFQRVTVEGFYTTPFQKMLRANTDRVAAGGKLKP
jgi:hypothetical protein